MRHDFTMVHARGPELARPGRASSIFRAGPGVIELARLVGLAQGRSSWLEKSSWPADGRAGSTDSLKFPRNT